MLWKTKQSNWGTETELMGVFVDFRKAFDTVDHEKLHCLSVRGNVCALMASYSADKK